ncbi:DNA ligase [Limnohabitans sp. B9-3]|uniref:DNA ligase n=1 Tax=Limnohabitans sp. B9-3 TaxID=1100707 RepID=UPI000C1E104D|nr:DNA ligase [Limnohabitans sp. B9-3]PIT74511.1 DNA ligase [Limnohabitans sp. B9-3]
MQRRPLLSLFSLSLLWRPCAQAATVPPIWLANTYTSAADLRDYWVSEKFDGVRGYWDGQQLLTRGGTVLRPPAWFTQGWPDTPFEGELWAGRGQFTAAVSVIQQANARDADWQKMHFMVFDLPMHRGTFTARIQAYTSLVTALGLTWVEAVSQKQLDSATALKQLLNDKVSSGAEGLMLHRANATYKSGRSNDQLKLKPHDDAEARVIEHLAGTGQYAGQTGALLVETSQGKRFKLGTGLLAQDRQKPPAIGEWVTYRYRGLTDKGLPRFASFLRIQPDLEKRP